MHFEGEKGHGGGVGSYKRQREGLGSWASKERGREQRGDEATRTKVRFLIGNKPERGLRGVCKPIPELGGESSVAGKMQPDVPVKEARARAAFHGIEIYRGTRLPSTGP